jgi:hypothetical protein
MERANCLTCIDMVGTGQTCTGRCWVANAAARAEQAKRDADFETFMLSLGASDGQ